MKEVSDFFSECFEEADLGQTSGFQQVCSGSLAWIYMFYNSPGKVE